MYFFCEPDSAPSWAETTSSSNVPAQAQNVQASIEGANASQFTGLQLTAWKPVTYSVPPPPPGPTPAVAQQSLMLNPTMVLRRQSPSKPSTIRVGSGLQTGITYVVSGQSDGSAPGLTIEKGGYLEISVQAQPVGSTGTDGQPFNMMDPNNRFTANVLVTGKYTGATDSWNPIILSSVLYVVQIDDGPNIFGFTGPGVAVYPAQGEPATTYEVGFVAGSTQLTIEWQGNARLWPSDDDVYPIEHVLGPVAGSISYDGFLYMLPSNLVVTWLTPPTGTVSGGSLLAEFDVTGKVGAYWYAPDVPGGPGRSSMPISTLCRRSSMAVSLTNRTRFHTQ